MIYQGNSVSVQALGDGIAEREIREADDGRAGAMRAELAKAPALRAQTSALTEAQIMAALGAPGLPAEGRFFPDTYAYSRGVSDLTVLRHITPWLDADLHDPRTVKAACYAVVNLGALDATDQLRKVAAEEDLDDLQANAVRIAALNALHQLNQLAAVDYQREARTGNETTRAVGVTDLGTISDKDAGPILAAALQNDSNHIRRMAAIGLGRLGNGEYGETLANALADPDALVRRYAAEGMVLLGYKRGIPKLLMAMDANLAGGDLRRAIRALAGDDFGYDPQANLIDRQDAVSRGFVWWNENEKNFR